MFTSNRDRCGIMWSTSWSTAVRKQQQIILSHETLSGTVKSWFLTWAKTWLNFFAKPFTATTSSKSACACTYFDGRIVPLNRTDPQDHAHAKIMRKYVWSAMNEM